MNLFQASLLSITQGVSEFLPISSSGHLTLVSHFLGLQPNLEIAILLHLATLLSVLVFFRKQIKFLLDNILNIIIGSIPAALIGYFFKNEIEKIFSQITYLPYFFLFTAVILLISKFLRPKNQKLNIPISFAIGIFQAFAILPGISRSGTTIFAGLLFGLSPLSALNYSFSLFIPVTLGSFIFDIKEILQVNILQPVLIYSFCLTFFVGLLTLNILKNIITKQKGWLFGLYLLALSLFLFLTV